jgi:fumarate reductase flavoprotein subunit
VNFKNIKIMPGFSVPRCLSVDPGETLQIMKAEAQKLGAVILLRTQAKRLFTNPAGRVVGLKTVTSNGKEIAIRASKAVVLASGGFARNTEMLKELGSIPLDLAIPVAAPGTTGDGHKMAFEVGAGTKNMGIGLGPGVAPSCLVDLETRMLCQTQYQGAVLLNKHGKRFVNESISYNQSSTVALNQPEALVIQIADEPIASKSHYTKVSSPKKAQTLEELAVLVGLDPKVLVAEIEKYNKYVEAGNDPDFGRNTMVGIAGKPVQIKTPPFYGFITKPGLLSTKGGISIDIEGRVLNVFGEVIPNLYAAGEITGGFHGAGYHTGSQFGKAVVIGRIVGKNAVAEQSWS